MTGGPAACYIQTLMISQGVSLWAQVQADTWPRSHHLSSLRIDQNCLASDLGGLILWPAQGAARGESRDYHSNNIIMRSTLRANTNADGRPPGLLCCLLFVSPPPNLL